MSKVQLEDVRKLREMTGAGVSHCKEALESADGDFNKAIEYLRKKGAATAAKRAEREANQGVVVGYVHNNRIAAILELNCETDFVAKNSDFKKLADELAMHIAASDPSYIERSQVPPEIIEKEKEIESEKIDQSKPKEVKEKILEGKLNKFYANVCLMEQPYYKDPDITVNDLINEKTAAIGEKIAVRRFSRFELGK
jgi:elongation factor Ts